MPENRSTSGEHVGPSAELISDVGPGTPPPPAGQRRAAPRSIAVGVLIAALIGAGAWVAFPGRSGAPSAPVPLPTYGEALPRQAIDIEVGQALTDRNLRLVILVAQPGSSATEPELISIGVDRVDQDLLGAAVFWGGQSSGEPGGQPGFVAPAQGSVVMTGGGRVLARDAGLTDPISDLGPGLTVFPGASADTVWVVDGEAIRLIDVPSGREMAGEPLERGRPLAGGPEGIVLGPLGAGEPFEIWQPNETDATHRPLAGSEGGALLGLGGGRVVIAVDEEMLVYDVTQPTGDLPATIDPMSTVPQSFDDIVESAVSPDGRHLAVGRQTELTEPDVVEIIDIDTGQSVQLFRPALSLSFSWVDDDHLAYVAPEGGRFHLIEAAVEGDEARTLLDAGDLNWFHQVVPVG